VEDFAMNTEYIPKARDIVTVLGKLGEFTVQTIDEMDQTAILGRISANTPLLKSPIAWVNLHLVKRAN
jgi:hypothetical protein